jgi:hypothetical protein
MTNEVFQGDNSSPVPFIFLMLAATVSFTSAFQLEENPIFHYSPDPKDPSKQNGRLKGQGTKANGSTSEVNKLFYINGGVCFAIF